MISIIEANAFLLPCLNIKVTGQQISVTGWETVNLAKCSPSLISKSTAKPTDALRFWITVKTLKSLCLYNLLVFYDLELMQSLRLSRKTAAGATRR